MRYTIAIIEDSSADMQQLLSFLNRYAGSTGGEFDIRQFQDGQTFLNNYQPIYDLVLMDIQLPGINGFETAVRLRKTDQAVTLIFTTSLARFAARGYEVDAMDFLVKPIAYPNFEAKLRRALARCRGNAGPAFLIPLPDGIYRISPARIKYVETSGHTLIYHTTEGTICSQGLLKDVEKGLDPRQFVRCNRCYLINLAFVRAVQGQTVLVDTDALQISRPKKKAFLAALNDYLGGGI